MHRLSSLLAGIFLSLATTASAAEMETRWIGPDDPLAETARQRGGEVGQELLQTLMGQVKAALKEGGPEHAVDFCNLQALPLTMNVTMRSGTDVLDVKRTSLQLRNPRNAPDPAEEEALRRVVEILEAKGELPGSLVQEVVEEDGSEELRFYKPIALQQGCLQCHGDPSSFSAGLRETLAENYPDDQATGYEEGDWRGLLRVSLAKP
jgi:hypothetical protein